MSGDGKGQSPGDGEISPEDREAIRKALGTTHDYQGVNGAFVYDGSGDNLRQEPRLLEYGPNGFEPMR